LARARRRRARGGGRAGHRRRHYLDSAAANADANFGAATSVKTLISSTDGSACRSLFRLPPELGLYPTAKLAKVEVCFYVFKDQTSGRHVTLYPLTPPSSKAPATPTAPRGTRPTAPTPGLPPAAISTPISPSSAPWARAISSAGTSRPLLLDAGARANLLDHGALLQIDELPLPTNGTPRAPFTQLGRCRRRTALRPGDRRRAAVLPHRDGRLSGQPQRERRSQLRRGHHRQGADQLLRRLRLPRPLPVAAGTGTLRTEEIAAANVYFYVWQDNTADRNVTLYPLTRDFAEVWGNGATNVEGATWQTCDGTNAWTAPGGDYDAAFPVVGVKETVLDPDLNDRFFRWDLAPLLANETARSNLLAHGALL
jgi:hypothetical protein